MSEFEKLLKELQGLKDEERSKVLNSKDTWNKIGLKEMEDLGFSSEEELKQWIENNPYSALS